MRKAAFLFTLLCMTARVAADGSDELAPPQGITIASGSGLLAAGTGLGQAMLIRDGAGFRAIATEGGHASFAPVSDLQIALLKGLDYRVPLQFVNYRD